MFLRSLPTQGGVSFPTHPLPHAHNITSRPPRVPSPLPETRSVQRASRSKGLVQGRRQGPPLLRSSAYLPAACSPEAASLVEEDLQVAEGGVGELPRFPTLHAKSRELLPRMQHRKKARGCTGRGKLRARGRPPARTRRKPSHRLRAVRGLLATFKAPGSSKSRDAYVSSPEESNSFVRSIPGVFKMGRGGAWRNCCLRGFPSFSSFPACTPRGGQGHRPRSSLLSAPHHVLLVTMLGRISRKCV